MTTTDIEIEHEQKVIETMRGWKRDARKLLRVTPDSITEFDVSMDRIIARSHTRIANLKAGQRPFQLHDQPCARCGTVGDLVWVWHGRRDGSYRCIDCATRFEA